MRFTCSHCGTKGDRLAGHINRARKIGASLYCNRECAGLGRRKPPKSRAQKIAEKAAYDRKYRARNIERLKAEKRAYFQRTYDPAKAAVERKKRMPRHVEYCRQPEYRAKKHIYDVRRYHEKAYGPLADASLLLKDLVSNINKRMTDYEVRSANQAVRNPQVRSAQEGVRAVRDRNRSAQGERP